mmetsp:Transcript_5540/g.12766  ORF Transcript_5540/g.12766 Transcript_5540/m.12766 type:complete len:86 (+) Transcript_5540:1084-1341(+)
MALPFSSRTSHSHGALHGCKRLVDKPVSLAHGARMDADELRVAAPVADERGDRQAATAAACEQDDEQEQPPATSFQVRRRRRCQL